MDLFTWLKKNPDFLLKENYQHVSDERLLSIEVYGAYSEEKIALAFVLHSNLSKRFTESSYDSHIDFFRETVYLGHLLCEIDKASNSALFRQTWIEKNYRNKGLASFATAFLLSYLKKENIEAVSLFFDPVSEGIEARKKYFKKMGFKITDNNQPSKTMIDLSLYPLKKYLKWWSLLN